MRYLKTNAFLARNEYHLRELRETCHPCCRTAVWVECPDAVLVLLCQVAADLDSNGRIDHADQRGRETDVPETERDRLSSS